MSQKKQSCAGGGFVWSRDLTTHLILLYEQHQMLYKVKSPEYKNKNTRQAALQEICNDLNCSHMTDLGVSDITKKIHGLRTTYFQELNKIKKTESSGSSPDHVYISKWWCFDLLYFLRDFGVVVHEGTSNMPVEAADNAEVIRNTEEVGNTIFEGSIDEFNESVTPLSPLSPGSSKLSSQISNNEVPSKRRKVTKENTELNIGLQNILGTASAALGKLHDKKTVDQNKSTPFGQMLAAEMEYITDDDILDSFKEEVMSALFNAKRKMREQNTFVD